MNGTKWSLEVSKSLLIYSRSETLSCPTVINAGMSVKPQRFIPGIIIDVLKGSGVGAFA